MTLDSLSDSDISVLMNLKRTYDEIVDYYSSQLPFGNCFETQNSMNCTSEWEAPQSVGIVLPKVTEENLTDLLMSCVPAQVAGVKLICLAVTNSEVFDLPLYRAFAALCGIKVVYHMGCVQAIGAMSLGTESVRRVNKIIGPGGELGRIGKSITDLAGYVSYVTIAPQRTIIADRSASALAIALEAVLHSQLSQGALCVIITRSQRFGDQIAKRISMLMRYIQKRNGYCGKNIVIARCFTSAEVRALTYKLSSPQVHMYTCQPMRLIGTPKLICYAKAHPNRYAYGYNISDIIIRTFITRRKLSPYNKCFAIPFKHDPSDRKGVTQVIKLG